jgi:hypothetical protein
MRFKPLLLLVAFFLLSSAAFADATFSGFLNDPTNTALKGSDLGAPLFDNDNDIANNVAIYTFNVATAGIVNFISTGFGLGGVDPYFTLFSGAGNSATFLDSNYANAICCGGDFTLSRALAVGTYTIAIGAFENLSFAENLGTGTLGDGFIGLGGYGFGLGSTFYKLDVTSGGVTPVPEPASIVLLASGLAGLAAWKRRQTA